MQRKKLVGLLLIALLIVLAGGGLYWAYKTGKLRPRASVTPQRFPSAKSGLSYWRYWPDNCTFNGVNCLDWISQRFDLNNSSDVSRADAFNQKGIVNFPYFIFISQMSGMVDQNKGIPVNNQEDNYYAAYYYAAQNNLNFENWFAHYKQDTVLESGMFSNDVNNVFEETVRSVYLKNPSGAFTNYSNQAEPKNTGTNDVPIAQNNSDELYLGLDSPYRQLEFTLGTSGQGFAGTWEYWNGSGWSALPGLIDGTSSMSKSGVVSWNFSDWKVWKRGDVNDFRALYWIRLKASNTGTVKPVASTIKTENFLTPRSDGNMGVPGWDQANDPNGDGFAEANVNSSATAKFKWWSRGIAIEWEKNKFRWYADPTSRTAMNQVVDHDLIAIGNADGVEYDCIDGANYARSGIVSGSPNGIVEIPDDATYIQGVSDTLAYARSVFNPQRKIVSGNTTAKARGTIESNLDHAGREAFLGVADSKYAFIATQYTTLLYNNSPYHVFAHAGKTQLLQWQTGGIQKSLGSAQAVVDREKMVALSDFYLLQHPATDYFALWYGFYYYYTQPPDKGYVDAIKYDIGQPTGQVPAGKTAAGTNDLGTYLFAQGDDPGTAPYAYSNCGTTPNTYYVFARDYTKALVLAKPNSDRYILNGCPGISQVGPLGDTSATTHQLPGTYYRLKVDGTLDTTPLTSITLRNSEGAILIKASASTGITLTKSAEGNPTSVKSGDTINYTITWKNNSTTEDYTNLVITDPVPPNTTFISAQDGIIPNPDLKWTIPSVPKGTGGTRWFSVKAN